MNLNKQLFGTYEGQTQTMGQLNIDSGCSYENANIHLKLKQLKIFKFKMKIDFTYIH
jgi:hypothetical protein